ncbi:FMN reductase [Corynebacterium glucuronolyticum]
MRTIVVVTAGLSQPSTTSSVAQRIADSVNAAVGARGEEANITTIELRDLAVDLAEALVSGAQSADLASAYEALGNADGIVAVSPTFSASYSSLFKMFFDVMDKDLLTDKPVLLAATAGTPRHSLMLEHAMRPLFSFLRARIVPTAVFVATEDFAGEHSEAIDHRIARAAGQLAREIVTERDHAGGLGGPLSDGPTAPLAEFNPNSFTSLLRKHTGE